MYCLIVIAIRYLIAIRLLSRKCAIKLSVSVMVTVALSLTVRSRFASECLRRSKQQGECQLGANIGEE